jgi:LMBR1 domain-containing protein 1
MRSRELAELGQRLRQEAEVNSAPSFSKKLKEWRKEREINKLYRQFKQEVVLLENDFEDLQYCHENWKNYNPLVPYCKLILGILSTLLSLLWILHIILYVLARDPYPNGEPVSYFLNAMFSWASKDIEFGLLGVVLVGIFCVYLLFCTLSGQERLGLKFLIAEIHPLKIGATYMSSLLFNVSLLLLCVPALIQFCSIAFSEYLALTDADIILGQYVRYMQFFRYFFEYNVFIFILLGMAMLSFTFVYFCVQDRNMKAAASLKERIQRFEGQKNSNKTVNDDTSSKKIEKDIQMS